MTQLVELQKVLPTVRDAGFEVFAISNDTVERLAEFAARHQIDYSLLSDDDSSVIRAFGILNTLIAPDEGKHMRWYGIPYPGTYIVDERAVVMDKEFHQHHARRASGTTFIHRLLGTVPDRVGDQPQSEGAGDDLSMSIYLADSKLRLEVISTLVCRLSIRAGRHVYARGAPDAFRDATLSFAGTGVRFGEPIWPPARDLRYRALDLSLPVHEGEIAVSVPITATSELIRLGHGLDQPSVDITVTLDYQSCDELSCAMPTAVQTSLTLPLDILVEPPGIGTYVKRVEDDAKRG
ncbi:MAG: redoxin domain-containing protein [Pseudomonadota bacterium]